MMDNPSSNGTPDGQPGQHVPFPDGQDSSLEGCLSVRCPVPSEWAAEVRANIARRAALVAHCRHDWRECIRVLTAAGELEMWKGRDQ
jgi:hypothetical protein